MIYILILLTFLTLILEDTLGSKLLNPTLKDSCEAKMHGGMIVIDHCKSAMTVTTLLGTKRMDCDTIKQRTFFGPVYINSDDCDQIMEGLELCDNFAPDASPAAIPCRREIHITTIIAIPVLALLLILQYTLLRLVYLGNFLRVGRYHLIASSNWSWDGKTVYLAKRVTTDGVSYNASGRELVMPSEVVRRKKIQFSLLRLVLFCYFFMTPKMVDATVHSMLLNSKHDVMVGDTDFVTTDARMTYGLTIEYNTATLTHSSSDEKFWWKSDCGSCISKTLYPKLDNEVAQKSGEEKSFSLSSCFSMTQGNPNDWLKDSCTKRQHTLRWNVNKAWVVMTTSRGTPQGVTRASRGSCRIIHEDFLAPSELKGVVIRSKTQAAHYCPGIQFERDPFPGKFGSFRYDSNDEVSYPREMISCYEHAGHEFDCEIKDYKVENYLNNCVQLPADYQGIRLTLEGDVLVARAQPAVRVVAGCLDEMKISTRTCGNLRMKASGTKMSHLGVMVQIVPERVTPEIWEGIVPCLNSSYIIPCDGEGILVVTNTQSQCMNQVPEESKRIIDAGPLDDIKWISETSTDEIHSSSNIFMNLKNLFGSGILSIVLASPLLTGLAILFMFKLFK